MNGKAAEAIGYFNRTGRFSLNRGHVTVQALFAKRKNESSSDFISILSRILISRYYTESSRGIVQYTLTDTMVSYCTYLIYVSFCT